MTTINNNFGLADCIVGIRGNKVAFEIVGVVTATITTEMALELSRNLMRMAFILEPPAETKAEEKP